MAIAKLFGDGVNEFLFDARDLSGRRRELPKLTKALEQRYDVLV